MLFTAIAIFVAFFFGFYASAVGSLKVVEKRISKHKNPETIISDFAILCEYEADQLGLETVNKIEFRLKTPKD